MKRQDSAFTFSGETLGACYDLNRINGPARNAIHRVKYVNSANEIKLVYR